jgi:hypothetical protein
MAPDERRPLHKKFITGRRPGEIPASREDGGKKSGFGRRQGPPCHCVFIIFGVAFGIARQDAVAS